MLSRELQIKELKSEIDQLKEENSSQSSLILSLRARIGDLQEETSSIENSQARGRYTIETLQQDARSQQAKVLELESRVRN